MRGPSVVLLAGGAYIRLSVMETPAFARVQERKEVSRLPLRDLIAAQPRRLLLGMGTRFIEGFTFNFLSVYLLAYVVTNLGLSRSLALGGVMVGAALGVVLVPVTGALSDRVGRRPVYRVGAWSPWSGSGPLIAAWLVTRGGGTLWWVAAYNVVVAAVSLTSARFLPETRGRNLDTPTADEPGSRALEPAPALSAGRDQRVRQATRGPEGNGRAAVHNSCGTRWERGLSSDRPHS